MANSSASRSSSCTVVVLRIGSTARRDTLVEHCMYICVFVVLLPCGVSECSLDRITLRVVCCGRAVQWGKVDKYVG